jgi:hypothetical protein
MASIINASTSTGLVTTADTSGVLQLQTGGTAAVTVDASQNVGIGTASPDTSLAVRSTGANGINLGESLNNSVVSSRLFFSNATAGQSAAIYNSSGGLLFTTGATLGSGSGTERMRVLSTGNILSLSGGSTTATGTGIAFPATQSASSDVNTLDDYEEGAWTPSSIVGTNLTGVSWSAGNYTKVGRLVTLIGYANCTVTSSNTLTYLAMTGAPFTTGIATSGSAFLNNNVRSGTSQISSASVYTFFSAASAPVAGAEIIQLSITYTV